MLFLGFFFSNLFILENISLYYLKVILCVVFMEIWVWGIVFGNFFLGVF